MADLFPPDAAVPRASSSQPVGRPAAGSTASKVRNSCQTCALSKVKCNKQKPTCYRCAKRCIKCEYLITKRPGRKRDNTQTTTDESNNNTTTTVEGTTYPEEQGAWPSVTAPSLTYATTSSESNGSLTTAMDLCAPSPGLSSMPGVEYSSLDTIANFLMPLEDFLGNDFNDFPTSPRYFLEWEEQPADPNKFNQARNDITSLVTLDNPNPGGMVSENSSTETTTIVSKPSYPVITNSQALSMSGMSLSDASDSTCRCSMQILDLMKELSTRQSPDLAPSNNVDDATTGSDKSHSGGETSARIVVEQNKQAIETITDMLQCSCAEDGSMLTMLSMVILKILGRYGGALQKLPGAGNVGCDTSSGGGTSTRDRMQQLSNYTPEVEVSWRMAAQSVLSELHFVQQLVNEFSPRLKAYGAKKEASKCGCVLGAKSHAKNGETTMTPSFSAVTLERMEVDMRKCLHTLSLEIIRILRES